MLQDTAFDLFAGVAVTDREAALKWYEQLLGSAPAFFPNDMEAVWELAEHRYLYIVQDQKRAGYAVHTLFVSDLDAVVNQISGRGLEPDRQEKYENGVRKITYADADGNEISFGGASA